MKIELRVLRHASKNRRHVLHRMGADSKNAITEVGQGAPVNRKGVRLSDRLRVHPNQDTKKVYILRLALTRVCHKDRNSSTPVAE
jgi:hypothetical protein